MRAKWLGLAKPTRKAVSVTPTPSASKPVARRTLNS